jgi:hypothetical protein
MLLADRWATHHDVERLTGGGAPVMGWAAALRLPLPPSTRLHESAFHGPSDRFWQRLQPLIYAAREAAVNVLSPRRSADGIKRLWMGNQASEAPTRRHQADFGFLIARGLLDPKENLYFLGGKVSAEASAKLAERTIRWSPENLGASPYLSYGERLAAFLNGAWISVAAFFQSASTAPASRLAVQAAPWAILALKLRPKSCLTTISYSWPEPPAMAVMDAAGARTAIWFTSANSFKYAESFSDYRDLDVGLSMVSSC